MKAIKRQRPSQWIREFAAMPTVVKLDLLRLRQQALQARLEEAKEASLLALMSRMGDSTDES